MPLLNLWRDAKSAVLDMNIQQVVGNAGNGRLRDGSDSEHELRAYLREVPSDKLEEYAQFCLNNAFEDGGRALQDIVNELARRLDFAVENGRYQGTKGSVGFDGVWRNGEASALVVEVKTTDTYTIKLETVERYRSKLAAAGSVHSDATVLFVVGRSDTGALEPDSKVHET